MKTSQSEPRAIPVKRFKSQQEWSAWLDKHHAASTGVWLRLAKKSAGVASVSYADAIEAALCYGWIDGQKKSDDEAFWLQKFTPRGDQSLWSRINRAKAERLIHSGQMKPAGLQAALEKSPQAKAFFATLNSRNRYAILFRIETVKKAETRARRIQEFIRMLEKKETLHR